jgi:hypothetical protein
VERVAGGQRLELRDQLTARAERGVGVDPFDHRRQPQLLQPADLSLQMLDHWQAGQRWLPPQRQASRNRAVELTASPAERNPRSACVSS